MLHKQTQNKKNKALTIHHRFIFILLLSKLFVSRGSILLLPCFSHPNVLYYNWKGLTIHVKRTLIASH